MAKKIESGTKQVGYVDNDDWAEIDSWQRSTQPEGQPTVKVFELFADSKLTEELGLRAAGDSSVTEPSMRWALA